MPGDEVATTVTDPHKVSERPNSGKKEKPADRMLDALGLPGLTYREKVVLAVIAWHDGNNGAYPSMKRLAEMAGTNRFAVAATLKGLEAKGAITRQRTQKRNLYTVAYNSHCMQKTYAARGNPTVSKKAVPPYAKSKLQSKQKAYTNREEQEGTGIGRSPPGERTPYPLVYARENASPPDSPALGQSDGDASEKLGETETATDEEVRQAVNLTPTMRPPERRSELDEMLDRYTELKDRLTDGELDADDRLALEAMLPGMETEIARLENGE